MNDNDKAYKITLADSHGKEIKSILLIGYENAKQHLKYEIDRATEKNFVITFEEARQ